MKLVILSLTIIVGNQARIEYFSPAAGTLYVDARASLPESWRNGWANQPTAAGTNTVTVALPDRNAGLFRLRLRTP